ncbi:MAG: hypothetical protein KDD70_00330 [Bdellovibrionales bacterium]|nr:hypothetical protein [Bdellovibrionales bacterium]
MEEFENPFIRSITHLENSGVEYVIVGGFAVVMHGCNRFTPDLNVMVSVEDEKSLAVFLQDLAKEEFIATTDSDPLVFLDDARRTQLYDEGRRWFFSFRNLESPSFSLDLFLKFPVPFAQVSERKVTLSVDDKLSFNICSLEDLVAMKSVAGRGQDKADIGALTLIKKLEELRNQGAPEADLLALGATDAEQEQIEGFLRFMSLTPKEKLSWLAEMLNHLGKFCVA